MPEQYVRLIFRGQFTAPGASAEVYEGFCSHLDNAAGFITQFYNLSRHVVTFRDVPLYCPNSGRAAPGPNRGSSHSTTLIRTHSEEFLEIVNMKCKDVVSIV